MARDIDDMDRSSFREDERRSPEAARALEPRRERQKVRERPGLELNEPEHETLREIGAFRTVAAQDLAQFRYHGNKTQMSQDMRSLLDLGLVQRRHIWTGKQKEKLVVFVLTKTGKAALECGRSDNHQAFYAGFVKPGEVRHDAAIYRMYQVEADKIRQRGGRVERVVLDYEFKKKAYSPLAKAKSLPRAEYAKRQAEIAHAHGLKVVNGHIMLPDLRIEYETQNGERAHLDLELATHHYRGSSMRSKAAAGFKMYAPQDSVARLTSAFDPEFAAKIFSI